VEAAIRRFYRDGFRSVGIDEVLADVGISTTAFYKHAESKEDLMIAALEMQNRWLQDTFRAMICERGGPTAIGQIYAVLDVVENIIESNEYQRRSRAGSAGRAAQSCDRLSRCGRSYELHARPRDA
jgi:AcrR family transcriptional regulator